MYFYMSQFNISHFFAQILSVISFLNELELICLHTRNVIVSTQENGSNYCSQTGSLAEWVEWSPMVRETWVQSLVESY